MTVSFVRYLHSLFLDCNMTNHLMLGEKNIPCKAAAECAWYRKAYKMLKQEKLKRQTQTAPVILTWKVVVNYYYLHFIVQPKLTNVLL